MFGKDLQVILRDKKNTRNDKEVCENANALYIFHMNMLLLFISEILEDYKVCLTVECI